MRELISKCIARLKYGYEIAEDCYLDALSKDELLITYGARKVKIYMERLKGRPNRILYLAKEKKWLPPYEHEAMPEEQYQSIVSAVVKHFEKLGEEVACKTPSESTK